MTMRQPKVFISYSHDSELHKRNVLELAGRLRQDGINVHLDQYEVAPGLWPAWMQQQIRDAEFTLLICTEAYRGKFEASDPSEGGLGSRWEGAIVTQHLYARTSNSAGFLPVLLSGSSTKAIPEVLSGRTYYDLGRPEGYELLYARLLNQAPVQAPPLGALRPSNLTSAQSLYDDYVLPPWDLSSKGLGGQRTVRNNLAFENTQFIGRLRDVEKTAANVRRYPLTTLIAPAGTGKTRLALAAAKKLVDSFRDGVWWISLASLSDSREIPHALAQTLGLFSKPEQADTTAVVHALRLAEMAIIFDNCERATVDLTPLIERINRSCQDVHILATSREPLGAVNEHAQTLGPLNVPATADVTVDRLRSSDAGALFLQRARAASSFQLTSLDEARAVARICSVTLGAPLAIELAAGATATSKVTAIAADIDNHIQLLGASQRDRTLEAVISWCSSQLTERERLLWERLAVFEGGFDQAAIEDVCSDDRLPRETIPGAVSTLLARAFIGGALSPAAVEDDSGTKRYQQLESMRHAARQRLVEAHAMTDLRLRHGTYYLRLAEAARPKLRQQDQAAWLAVLEAEHDNLRAALHYWQAVGNPEAAMRLGGALGRFWHMRGYWHEGRRLLLEVLRMPRCQDYPEARSAALVAKGHLAFVQADYVTAKRYYDEALELRRGVGNVRDIANSLHRVGCVTEVLGDFRSAQLLQQEALGLARQSADEELQADVLHHLGVLAGVSGMHQEARAFHEQSLDLRKALKDLWGQAWSMVVLGNHHRYLGNTDEAKRWYRQSLDIYEKQGDRRRVASSLVALADVAVMEREMVSARESLLRATQLAMDLGDLRSVAEAIESWAVLFAAADKAEQAHTLIGAANALREFLGAKRSPLADAWMTQSVGPLDSRVTLAERHAWQSAGARFGPREAVIYAAAG